MPVSDYLVDLARDLQARTCAAKFDFFDAVLLEIPWGEDANKSGAEALMRDLAERSGMAYETIRAGRRTAAKTSAGRRRPAEVPWTVYVEIAAQPDDLIDHLLSFIDEGGYTTPSGRPTKDLIRQVIKDQRQPQATPRSSPPSTTPRATRSDNAPAMIPSAPPQPVEDLVTPAGHRISTNLELFKILNRFAYQSGDLLTYKARGITPGEQEYAMILEGIGWAKEAIERIERYLRGEQVPDAERPENVVEFRPKNAC